MECLQCPPGIADKPSAITTALGVAGGSARREFRRRQNTRANGLTARWGTRIGRLIYRFADEPQSIRAWGLGGRGEELLGEALATVPGLVVLNDRRVQGTKGNIDHIAIAPAGVFVVDAKFYEGILEVIDRGGLFRTDLRLTIGGRDRSKLTDGMEWQVKAVIGAMTAAGIDPLPAINSVLCFVDGNWPIFRKPKTYNGVRLESERSLVRLMTSETALNADKIDRIARALAEALPPK